MLTAKRIINPLVIAKLVSIKGEIDKQGESVVNGLNPISSLIRY